jgi:hypothetical protein
MLFDSRMTRYLPAGNVCIGVWKAKGMFTSARAVWAEANCVEASDPIAKADAIRLELRMEASRVFFMTRSPLEGQRS